jgi:phosphatidylserine decarboxylase
MTDAKDTRVPEEHHVQRVRLLILSFPFRPVTPLSPADSQTGQWLSQDKRHHHKFLHDTIEHVDKNPKPVHPAIEKFGQAVKNDTRLYMLFSEMFSEASDDYRKLWHV